MTLAPHLILIDGSGFIFRAFHALPPMTRRSDSLPVNAIYGFTNMLLRYITPATLTVDYLAVVFDTGRATFRQTLYPAYKSHRPEAPAELLPQFPFFKQACAALNVATVDAQGFEADDVIATYVQEGIRQGLKVTVVSSDKDLMQLVAPNVQLWDPFKNQLIGPEEVVAKFGVPPGQVIEVQALAGDSSDGVPGVPGIGLKTAAQLIQTFSSLEGVLAHTPQIAQPKRRAALETFADQARLSRELVTLRQDVPLPLPLTALARQQPHLDAAMTFLQEMDFSSLLARFQRQWQEINHVSGAGDPPFLPVDADKVPTLKDGASTYELIQTAEALQRWIEAAKAAGIVAVDTETTSLNPLQAELVGVSLATAAGKACYIPVGHKRKPATLFDQASPLPTQLDRDWVLAQLRPLLTDPHVLKVGHNLKYDLGVLRKYQVTIHPVDDTMLLSYVLNPGPHGLDELAARYLDHQMISYKEVVGKGREQVTFDYVDLEAACTYAAEDADMTLRLHTLFKPQLAAAQVTTVYETLEKPLIAVLCEMEANGIQVDPQVLKDLSHDFSHRLNQLEQEIYQLAGHEFNIASPKQLATVLFEEMQLTTGKKGKTGTYSTNADVLEVLSEAHPLPQLILEWRQLAKLKSTYTDALVTQINPQTGRIHTSFSMATTNTGRLASTDPNLQNIPIRTEEGRKIRGAFVAAPGHVLMSADYSQIELRLLAHYADIPHLTEAFHAGTDIHALTASMVFQKPLATIDADLRRQAKAINFGIIYGISAFGLAKQLGVPQGAAARIIEAYFEQYPGIQAYMDARKAEAAKQGYVTTLFGRRCYIPHINNKNPALRQGAERQAINAPLQGSNADIIKRAMIRLWQTLKDSKLQAKMLLQVHDELVLEVPQAEVEATAALVKAVMEKGAEGLSPALKVPLVVEVGVGPNWRAAH